MPSTVKVVESTTMMIDIRNFTPNLLDSAIKPTGKPEFCYFLEQFLNECFKCFLCAMPDIYGADPPIYVNSTGDGMLAIFTSDNHYIEAYLAGLLIFRKLKPLCTQYNRRRRKSLPAVSFGIGIESGPVSYIKTARKYERRGMFIETYIGNSINIAARVEQVNKSLDRTNMIISGRTNQLLCERLFNKDYEELIRKALDRDTTDKDRKIAYAAMNELNFKLCVNFVTHHLFKGVRKSIPIYRVSNSLADPTRKDFAQLVKKHMTSDAAHYAKVMKLLSEEPAFIPA